MRRPSSILAACSLLTLLLVPAARADWPQFLGPDRNAALDSPADPPVGSTRVLWERPSGKAYSSVAVRDGVAYTMESDGDSDFAVALEADTGEERWRVRLDEAYLGHGGSDDGPTSTPTVTDSRVFLVSPHGKLFALDRANGKTLWMRDLVDDFGAVAPTWSFSTSPLLEQGRLIVQVGGRGGKHNLVAFEPATGKVLWSVEHDTPLAYSSPLAVTLDGVPQVVVAGEKEVYAVEPEHGRILWSHEAPQRDKTIVTLLPGNRLLVGSWNEALLLEAERAEGGDWSVDTLWTSPYLKGSYSPAVYYRGHLYGVNGSILVCLNPGTGEPVWRGRAKEGSLIRVGSILLFWGDGELRALEATDDGYRQRLRRRLMEPGGRTVIPPSYAGGTVFVRHGERIFAVELEEAAPAR